MEPKQEKSKEQILAERKAKKAAKKQPNKKDEVAVQSPPTPAKIENQPKPSAPAAAAAIKQESVQSDKPKQEAEKSREEVKAEREAKKLAKQAAKKKTSGDNDAAKNKDAPQKQLPQEKQQSKENTVKTQQTAKTGSDADLAQKMENLHIADAKVAGDQVGKENKPQTDDQSALKKGKPTSKAERRALQEAQRAEKAKQQAEKAKPSSTAGKKPAADVKDTKVKSEVQKVASASPPGVISQKSTALHKVRLFKHLYTEKCDLNIKVNSRLHPAIIKLGTQYATSSVVGCNSRCYAFLNAMQVVSIWMFNLRFVH